MALVIPGLPVVWDTIDGSPIDLSVVPNGPQSPDDSARQAKLSAFHAWRSEVKRYRAVIRAAAESSDDLAQWERAKCASSPSLYFPTVYGWVYEPRQDGLIPAIPYPFQVAYLQWMDERAQGAGADANGAVSKSRDMGATWFACLRCLGLWLFREPYTAKLISRREDLVDDPGNMDSMMERIAENIRRIPSYLRPLGWEAKLHRQKLKITRPDNKNAILGESTSARSGRGGRSTEAIVDESAFIEQFRRLIAALQQTAAHVLTVSSESVETSEEYLLYKEALTKLNPDSLYEMDYWLHPNHSPEWLAEQHERYAGDEAGFAREILRQPDAGLTEFVYPSAQEKEILGHEVTYIPGQGISVCLDPGLRDETAFHVIVSDYVPGRDLVLTSFEANSLTPEAIAAILCGCDLDWRQYVYVDDPKNEHYVHPHDRFPDFGLSAGQLAEYQEVAAFFARLSHVPTIYGDPNGSAKFTGESWYERMIRFSLRFNPRLDAAGEREPLIILWSWKDADREDQGRRTALMNWLPRLDFNGNQQAQISLTALQRSKWETNEKARMTEQKSPKHDLYSHRRTALEYGAVNLDFSRAVATIDMTVYLPSQHETDVESMLLPLYRGVGS